MTKNNHYAISDMGFTGSSIIEKRKITNIGDIISLLEENDALKRENKHLRCTIESNSQDDYIDYLENQNDRLKEIIESLSNNDKIVFMNCND